MYQPIVLVNIISFEKNHCSLTLHTLAHGLKRVLVKYSDSTHKKSRKLDFRLFKNYIKELVF
jgi:hypothetical protein